MIDGIPKMVAGDKNKRPPFPQHYAEVRVFSEADQIFHFGPVLRRRVCLLFGARSRVKGIDGPWELGYITVIWMWLLFCQC